MPGTEAILESSGRHRGHGPDEEIGRASAFSIRRWLRALLLLWRRSLCLNGWELFAVGGVLRLGCSPGDGRSFSLRRD
jgi:hypothetical protein